MNKCIVLFLIIVLPGFLYSQSDSTKNKKFILASVSLELGRMIDRYPNIDLSNMEDWTLNPADLDRNLIGHEVTYDRDVEGSRIGASIALIPFNKKENDYSKKSEIRVGLFYSQRGTHLSYLLTTMSGAFKSISYSTRFKELSLSGAYVWKYNPKFAKRFTLHAGLGLGLGSTLYDKTSVAEHYSNGQANEIPTSFFNVYKGKSSFFGRAFTPIGIDFALAERFDVGVESTFGVAMQQVYSGKSYFIPISGSLSVKISYFF